MQYPVTAQPPTVYASGSNPDHATIMAYYWTSDIDYRVLDVVDTDNMNPDDVPHALPFVTSYATQEPQRMFGDEAMDFVQAYIQYMESRRPTGSTPQPDLN